MRRRALELCGLMWIAIVAASIAIAAEQREFYTIEIRLLNTAKDGKPFVVSRPTVSTVKDQEVVLDVSGKSSLATAKLEPREHSHGIALRAMLYDGEHQELMIDAEFKRASELEAAPGASRFVTQQIRIVEPVKLGEAISVPLDPDSPKSVGSTLEIRVTQGKPSLPVSSVGTTTTTVAIPHAADK